MSKTYDQIDRELGERNERTIGNNTTARRDSDDSLASITIALHGNDIARLHAPDAGGKVEYTLAGWNTPTTRSRINEVLPVGIKLRTVKGAPMINDDSRGEREISDDYWYTVLG